MTTKAPPPPEESCRSDGDAEVSWLGVVARGAFPPGSEPEPVAIAAELALTVAGAAPVSHRTSLSHRERDASTPAARPVTPQADAGRPRHRLS